MLVFTRLVRVFMQPIISLFQKIFINNHYNNNIRYSFSILSLFAYLDIYVPETAKPLVEFAGTTFFIALCGLFCFSSVVSTLLCLYFKDNNIDINENFANYPRLIKYINYSKKVHLNSLLIDIM